MVTGSWLVAQGSRGPGPGPRVPPMSLDPWAMNHEPRSINSLSTLGINILPYQLAVFMNFMPNTLVFSKWILSEMVDHTHISRITWGYHLSVGTTAGEVQVWDGTQSKQLRSLRGHAGHWDRPDRANQWGPNGVQWKIFGKVWDNYRKTTEQYWKIIG